MTQAMSKVSTMVLALVASAAMLGISAGPAAAATDVTVKVARHELATVAGLGQVQARLYRAVRRACAAEAPRTTEARQMERACKEVATKSAERQLAQIAGNVELAAR